MYNLNMNPIYFVRGKFTISHLIFFFLIPPLGFFDIILPIV